MASTFEIEHVAFSFLKMNELRMISGCIHLLVNLIMNFSLQANNIPFPLCRLSLTQMKIFFAVHKVFSFKEISFINCWFWYLYVTSVLLRKAFLCLCSSIPWFLPKQIQGTGSYVEVLDPFGVEFCAEWQKRICFIFLHGVTQVVLDAPFAKGAGFSSPVCNFCLFV